MKTKSSIVHLASVALLFTVSEAEASQTKVHTNSQVDAGLSAWSDLAEQALAESEIQTDSELKNLI